MDAASTTTGFIRIAYVGAQIDGNNGRHTEETKSSPMGST